MPVQAGQHGQVQTQQQQADLRPSPDAAPLSPREDHIHVQAAAVLVQQYLARASPSQGRSSQPATCAGHSYVPADATKLSDPAVQQQQAQAVPVDELVQRATAASVIQAAYRKRRQRKRLVMRPFSKHSAQAMELVRRYVEGGAGCLVDERFATSAHLVLHFDVNKTILISDKAQDASTEHMVNVLLSECAWGRLEPGPAWVPVGRLATDRPANDPQLMTYRSFLDSFLLPFELGAGPQVELRNSHIKNQRHALKRKFTEAGQPGDMFRGVYDRLRAALAMPAEQCSGPLFQAGERRLLPSFFNLLLHLQCQKRRFTIIFRTFGCDMAEVAAELALFCEGRHPAYPAAAMDGRDGTTDLRLHLPHCAGAFHRSSAGPSGTLLCLGLPAQLLHRPRRLEVTELTAAAASTPGSQLLATFQEMYDALMQVVRSGGNRALALRDYYPFWKARNERSHAGKLLLLDPAEREVLHIFFDDNIGHSTAHIVDARHAVTGQPLPFQEVVGKHVVKVEPLNAILDPQYFVRAVHECAMAAALHAHATNDATAHSLCAANVNGRPSTEEGGLGASTRQPRSLAQQRSRSQVARTSVRARELWQVARRHLLHAIRVRNAIQDELALSGRSNMAARPPHPA